MLTAEPQLAENRTVLGRGGAHLRAGRAAAVVTAEPQLAEKRCSSAMRPLADLMESRLLAS